MEPHIALYQIGETLTIICSYVDGFPKSRVRWYFNGNILRDGDRSISITFAIRPGGNVTTILQRSNVGHESSGSYVFSVSNLAGTLSDFFVRIINGKLKTI